MTTLPQRVDGAHGFDEMPAARFLQGKLLVLSGVDEYGHRAWKS